jgi:alanyl-tRNA synthetase
MTLPARDTRVTYPDGALSNTSIVLHTARAADGRLAVITEATSFHPVDAAWPDQPADAGAIIVHGERVPVLDAVIAATDGSELFLDAEIPVRKGTEGWAFLIAHLVDGGTVIAEGDEIEIEADASVRHALSIGHTACHVASLALNRALADRWSKPARTDALGSPDFDGIAIASSRIEANGSTDTYRLNKSLRRAGFDTGAVAAEALEELGASVTSTLAAWTATGGEVRIERDGDALTDRRTWRCELPEGTARILCGGTHARSLSELGRVDVRLELLDHDGTPVLSMHTTAHPQP